MRPSEIPHTGNANTFTGRFHKRSTFQLLAKACHKEQRGSARAQSWFGAHRMEQVSWEAALEEELAGLQCALFLWRAIPWEDLNDSSGIGLLVHHSLPRESLTISWEGETGNPHWKVHVRQQLHHSSRIPLVNRHRTAAETSSTLPPAFLCMKQSK